MSSNFDVVIVGAGPAGGHCARLLAQSGYQVLLVEQHSNFQQNNFSSAASPLEVMENFHLPETVVASYWNKLEIITTKVKRAWQSSQLLGVVFDFAKLREFLAQEVRNYGGEVWLGHRYLSFAQEGEQIWVKVKNKAGEVITVSSRVLVDATGFKRAVMYGDKREKPEFLKGVGIEYLIRVNPEDYQPYAQDLIFFLGHQWSPKGYAWIFPMDNYQLKVGVAWLEGEHKYIETVKPLRTYIHNILDNYMGLAEYDLVESHGSILEYSVGLKDIYYKDKNIIAIGDAVSTVNFLGGEGIRHAFKASEIARDYLLSYLQGESQDFHAYPQALKAHFLPAWNLSEQMSTRVFLEYSDHRIDQGVSYLKYLSLQDILDILFYYRFEKYTKGLGAWLWQKLQKLFNH
jgi:flavin-dependent dehydrogenase